MTTNEAFDATMAEVGNLETLAGIKVLIRPSKQRENAEIIAKYNGPERVAPDRWVNVTFKPVTPEQKQAIADAAKHLGWLGIGFDTGGMCHQRDWELDWSFNYTARPDGEQEEARDIVEDMLTNLMEGDAEGPPK